MIDISAWMEAFLTALDAVFAGRVWFVGLQGSYARGEATETSDLDVVVVLDELTVSDLRAYREMLDRLPHREKLCGFLSGKNELLRWEPSDLFRLYHDTMPIKGSLDDLKPFIDGAALDRAIKIGACNIYHGCVHNMLHERSEEILKGLYKSASFVVQAIAFRQTGKYINCQKDLLPIVSSDERTVVEAFLRMKSGEAADLDKMSELLFSCSKKWI